ncbi:MAG: DNA primase [Christensenellales bacterium]
MARFPDGWLSELYAKNDIVDVISAYTSLSERGGQFWGLCPFHKEKTPSFSVSKEKQLYYCFGCKQGGNVANFVMNTENVSFVEAVEMLAKRANVDMPKTIKDNEYEKYKQKRQQIAEMHRIAARFYHDMLFSPKGQKALAYLKKRGIEDTVIKRFGIGYAPDSWDSVLSLVKQKGYPPNVIKDSGLVSIKDSKMFDAFRNRIMFPIFNVFGDIIAFGGRGLGDSGPKYLNTKETIAFKKKRNLYGIDLIRKIKKVKSVVIVEGYMDVVSLYAHGVKSVVASLGTALTKEQALLLKRYTKDVFIAYDGDEAGEIATIKALRILSEQGFQVKVIRFEEGLDPDDYIKKHGLGGFAKKVRSAPSAIGYRLDIAKRNFDLDTDDGKERYAVAAAEIIASIESPIIKERYAKRLTKETGFSQDSILKQTEKKDVHKNTNANNRYNSIKKSDYDSVESAFLAYIIANASDIITIADQIRIDDFNTESHKNIFSALYDSVKRGIQPTYAELISELEYEADRSEVARLSGMRVVADNPEEYLKDCISHMRIQRLTQIRQELIDRLRDASGEEKRNLLAEIGEKDKELNQRRF